MCGLAGYIGRGSLSQVAINKTLRIMDKSGPDAFGNSLSVLGDLNVHFLHSRLTIIDDNSRSNQPMEAGDYSLVFNGEIYNYLELRDDLKDLGYVFTTESDTEVLLKMLIHYGDRAFDMLDGAWSLAFLDKKRGRLVLSRDRFSEKPLYYLKTQDGYYFGSSPMYILSLSERSPRVNLRKLERFVRYDFKSMYINNETFIQGVKSLPFASNLTISLNGSAEISQYCCRYESVEFDGVADIVNTIRKSLIKSLEYRMRSDKSIAFLLSGGVDSTTLCYLASKNLKKKITCFSIGAADHQYDESGNIDQTVSDLGCNHFYVQPQFNAEDILNRLSEFSSEFSSPLPGQNYLLYAELNNIIKSKGFDVVISGHGGDELFGGYFLHHNCYVKSLKGLPEFDTAISDFNKYVKPQLRNKQLADIEGFCNSKDGLLNSFEESTHIRQFFTREVELEVGAFLQYNSDPFKKKLDEDLFYLTLPQHVVASDQVSMFFSLENRAPLLSKEVYEVARSIPNDLLISRGYGKYILRKSMEGIIPSSILWDRDKVGFNFEFSSSNIEDFSSLFLGIDKMDFFKSFINMNQINRLISRRNITNAESKLLFRIANAKALLSTVN